VSLDICREEVKDRHTQRFVSFSLLVWRRFLCRCCRWARAFRGRASFASVFLIEGILMVRREQIESQESKRDTHKSTIKVSFPVEEHKKK
jgi:hypothetical protein